MAKLRLYKEFYRIDYINGVNDNYTLINPFAISASTFVYSTSQLVENLTITQESLGSYYVDISAHLYSYPTIYQIIWYVEYLNNGIVKQLRTKFVFDLVSNNIITELDFELYNNIAIDYEITNSFT